MRPDFLVLPILAATLALSAPALARTDLEGALKQCASEAIPPAETLVGCEAAIAAKRLPKERLASVYFNRALTFREMREPDLAIADLTEVLRLDPDSGRAYFNRALIHDARGDLDAALPDYASAHRLLKGLRFNYRIAAAYLEHALAARLKGDADTVIADLTGWIGFDANDLTGHIWRGDAYRARGDLERAIADYAAVADRSPTDPRPFRHRGVALIAKGEFEKAISDFDRALYLDPKDTLSKEQRALALAGKTSAGDSARALDEGDADYLLRLAQKWISFKEDAFTKRAEAALRKALVLNPRLTAAADLLRAIGGADMPYGRYATEFDPNRPPLTR